MTLYQLFEEGKEKLEKAGITEAETDSRRLLLEAFQTDMTHFLTDRMMPLRQDKACEERTARYRGMIRERAGRKPLQYILGRQEFMGLEFYVNRHVLIPRQDTETLTELVLEDTRKRSSPAALLDLCTGSGCIAVSLAALGRFRHVAAADLSPKALDVAEINAKRLLGADWRVERGFGGSAAPQALREQGTDERVERGSGDSVTSPNLLPVGADARCFHLYQGDLFQALPPGQKYDVLVSNPPYIPTNVISGLQPEVREHEPVLALDGSEDGLEFYRRIAGEAAGWLNPGAAIYLEIGYDQAGAVSGLLADAGFRRPEVFQDLPGLDRVIRAYL